MQQSDPQIVAPEVAASRIRKDKIVPGIPVDGPKVVSEGALPVPGSSQCADPVPTRLLRVQLATGNVVQLVEAPDDWLREVTLLGMGTAAQVEISSRPDFGVSTFLGAGLLPVIIPLRPGQSLWMRQNSGVAQDIDGLTEPLERRR